MLINLLHTSTRVPLRVVDLTGPQRASQAACVSDDPLRVGLAHIAMLIIQRMISIATLSGTLVRVWSGFISILILSFISKLTLNPKHLNPKLKVWVF